MKHFYENKNNLSNQRILSYEKKRCVTCKVEIKPAKKKLKEKYVNNK